MKKGIGLLLAALLLVLLAGCGGNAEKDLVGTWSNDEMSNKLILKANGIGNMMYGNDTGESLDWTYKNGTVQITLKTMVGDQYMVFEYKDGKLVPDATNIWKNPLTKE